MSRIFHRHYFTLGNALSFVFCVYLQNAKTEDYTTQYNDIHDMNSSEKFVRTCTANVA